MSKIYPLSLNFNSNFTLNYDKSSRQKVYGCSHNSCDYRGSVNFMGNSRQLLSCVINPLKPIKSLNEYREVLAKACHSVTPDGQKFWTINNDYNLYKGIDEEYIGLLPYCGGNDVSYYINQYLRSKNYMKTLQKYPQHSYCPTLSSITDIIRVLDYSLGRLDENVGTYSGIVYRKGHFNLKTKQFYSCSYSPAIASSFSGVNLNTGYSVIRTKSAHNIYAFQKQMNSLYAKNEKEILISRKAKHRLLKEFELDSELKKAKTDFAMHMLREVKAKLPVSQAKTWDFDRVYKKIKVYEEI